jgi:excinuclease ABC subunit B
MEGARVSPGAAKGSTRRGKQRIEVIEIPESPKALGKLLDKLEKKMLDHAQNLEFEEAAAVRDQLQMVRDARLKM